MKIKFFFLLVLLLGFSLAEAQTGPSPGPATTGGPIDGGAIFLLVVIGLYGYLKLRKIKGNSNALTSTN